MAEESLPPIDHEVVCPVSCASHKRVPVPFYLLRFSFFELIFQLQVIISVEVFQMRPASSKGKGASPMHKRIKVPDSCISHPNEDEIVSGSNLIGSSLHTLLNKALYISTDAISGIINEVQEVARASMLQYLSLSSKISSQSAQELILLTRMISSKEVAVNISMTSLALNCLNKFIATNTSSEANTLRLVEQIIIHSIYENYDVNATGYKFDTCIPYYQFLPNEKIIIEKVNFIF
jgi:hypothetical protein